MIADILKAITDYKDGRAKPIKAVQESQTSRQATGIIKKKRWLAAAQKRAGELGKLV